jgi:uncharacterized protein YdeI (YjbR/CyaY-like superfamily)
MNPLPDDKLIFAAGREEWRDWLALHHSSEKEAWLVIYKKNSGKQTISYVDAVEEALCFGWIDSAVKKLDDESHAQKFSPRRPGSNWAESNKQRVRALIASGRMTEAGLAAVTFPLDDAGES